MIAVVVLRVKHTSDLDTKVWNQVCFFALAPQFDCFETVG